MTPELLQILRVREPTLRERWEALLRIEPVNGPLANPDALVHLIPDSLGQIFKRLAAPVRTVPTLVSVKAERLPPCDCGNNPFLAYFIAGEQALVETVILLQAEMPPAGRTESDVAEAIRAVRQLARSEIDAFCGICTHHGHAPHCRHTPVNTTT